MKVQITDIMHINFLIIDACTSLRKIQELSKDYLFFIVMENNTLIGVLSHEEIITANPNRIAIDALTASYDFITPTLSIWEAQDKIFAENNKYLLVFNDNKICGIIDKNAILIGLAKCFDPLTNLYKTDFIYYHGMKMLNEGNEISVIFIDINNFGSLNKTYGHINGDMVLQELSTLLQKNIPNCCYLCRFGGDEFALMTPYHIHQSTSLASHLVRVVTDYQFGTATPIPVTISAGIAGGRRYTKRFINDPQKVVANLINQASLESTKAKNQKCHLSTAKYINLDEIA